MKALFFLSSAIFLSFFAVQSCISSNSTGSNYSKNLDSKVEIFSGKYFKIQFLTGVEIHKFQPIPVVAVLNDIETFDKNGINKNNNIIKNCRLILDAILDSTTNRIILTASKMTCVKDNKIKDFEISGYVTDDEFVFGIKAPREKIKNYNPKSEDFYKISRGKTAYFLLTSSLSISF